ncbi:hypothetical protein U1Q18_034691, partial [Sarracenia purpurea var. burkii]
FIRRKNMGSGEEQGHGDWGLAKKRCRWPCFNYVQNRVLLRFTRVPRFSLRPSKGFLGKVLKEKSERAVDGVLNTHSWECLNFTLSKLRIPIPILRRVFLIKVFGTS